MRYFHSPGDKPDEFKNEAGEMFWNTFDKKMYTVTDTSRVVLFDYLQADGSVDLATGYVPVNPLSIATKEYVDAGFAGISSIAFKNVLMNANFTVNQRDFDGNWGALGIGDYGFDRWKKSASGITQVVESGFYAFSSEYFLSGVGVTSVSLTSPASGNWDIEVPDGASEIQLELQGETPFEVIDISIDTLKCQRYFQRQSFVYLLTTTGEGADTNRRLTVPRGVFMRATPTEAVGTPNGVQPVNSYSLDGTNEMMSFYADCNKADTIRFDDYTAEAEL